MGILVQVMSFQELDGGGCVDFFKKGSWVILQNHTIETTSIILHVAQNLQGFVVVHIENPQYFCDQ